MESLLGISFGPTEISAATIEKFVPRAIEHSCWHAAIRLGGPDSVSLRLSKTTQGSDFHRFPIAEFLGRSFNEIKDFDRLPPCAAVGSREGTFYFDVQGNCVRLSSIELAAALLRRMKSEAELSTKSTFIYATIGVPSWFDDVQRTAVMDAARIAGFRVLGIANQTALSALALQAPAKPLQKILVCVLHEESFEVAAIEAEDGIYEVKGVRFAEHQKEASAFEVVESIFSISDLCVASFESRDDEIHNLFLVGIQKLANATEKRLRKAFRIRSASFCSHSEAIAKGAAVWTAARCGLIKDLLLLDVLGVSIWIRQANNPPACMISENTTFPTRKSEIFPLNSFLSGKVEVLQGESGRKVGELQLQNSPHWAQTAEVEVTLDLDSNGQIRIAAAHPSDREKLKIVVPVNGLLNSEIGNASRKIASYWPILIA
jgi:molecular chaperone DnaK (HSP70)